VVQAQQPVYDFSSDKETKAAAMRMNWSNSILKQCREKVAHALRDAASKQNNNNDSVSKCKEKMISISNKK
jgi:hypothetical protein